MKLKHWSNMAFLTIKIFLRTKLWAFYEDTQILHFDGKIEVDEQNMLGVFSTLSNIYDDDFGTRFLKDILGHFALKG